MIAILSSDLIVCAQIYANTVEINEQTHKTVACFNNSNKPTWIVKQFFAIFAYNFTYVTHTHTHTHNILHTY